MASINCPQCGAPVDSQSTFCGNCGYSSQTDGKATYRPQQGQPGGAYSSPQAMDPNDRTSPSAPTYQMNNGPIPPNRADTSSPTYLAGGPPPPPPFYANNNAPSSADYPRSGANFSPMSPQSGGMNTQPPINYSGSSANYPPTLPSASGPNLPPTPPAPRQPRRRGNGGIIAISILALIVILAGGGLYVFRGALLPKTGSTSNSAATSQTATATVPTATATTSTNVTPTDTASASTTPTDTTSASTTPTVVPTLPTSSNSYTAIQPGPGCDTSGGTWTPQNISKITCGTTINTNGNIRGYLYLQLPNNKAFSSSNIIGVSSALQSSYDCVGLAEQSTNTGYLAEYCYDGTWYVDTISSGGAVIQTLAKSITSTRSTEQLSLTIKGATLSFSIDTETHNVTIPAGPVTKVAITIFSTYSYGGSLPVTNFSYTAQ